MISSVSSRLNSDCVCITLDRDALRYALEQQSGDPSFLGSLLEMRPHLFSNVAVFVEDDLLIEMQRVVEGIETVSGHPAYRSTVLGWAPPIAVSDFGPRGVFMGYDFHLADDGPALIEINTNAGGAMLNAVLASAQRACCGSGVPVLSPGKDFGAVISAMLTEEWLLQRGRGRPTSIAIVDDQPQGQYLYPEFVLFQRMLERQGILTCIADAQDLIYRDGTVRHNGTALDLVYNRLTDFSLALPEHEALRQAYLDGAVVLTPNPRNHALFADKRNLTLLSNRAQLESWGVDEGVVETLAGAVPATERVTSDNADQLWANRRRLFFKPSSGYGSRAAYRGDKLTKAVWADILRGDYVAQALVPPSERVLLVDGVPQKRKVDLRLYTYNGRVLLVAARLYQGQTTNMRTAGGGFAPVLRVKGGVPI